MITRRKKKNESIFSTSFFDHLLETLTANGKSTEHLTKPERRASDGTANMFGDENPNNKSRAHQIPKNPACNCWWGPVSEASTGVTLDGVNADKAFFLRSEMAKWMSRFKVHLFPFETGHNAYYDMLDDGLCVLLVPLLSTEKIAGWKRGDSYDVLVVCSSAQAHKKLGKWTKNEDFQHMKWVDQPEDLEVATICLSEHVKALADSLKNVHWTSYFTKVESEHTEFKSKKEQIFAAKAALDKSNGYVEVPDLKRPRFGAGRMFFKIRFGDLYSGEAMKQLIPDPMLLAFKAAVNWSGRKEATRLQRLLPACFPEVGFKRTLLSLALLCMSTAAHS
jgi:hypothetical protein